MISVTVSTILVAIALVHLAWGTGIYWPAPTETQLARTVVGTKGIARMPNFSSCLIVAIGLMVAGFWTLLLGRRIEQNVIPDWIVVSGGVLLVAVFFIRGVAGNTSAWAAITPEQPFRTYDRWIYSPLSLLVGLAIGYLCLDFWGVTVTK